MAETAETNDTAPRRGAGVLLLAGVTVLGLSAGFGTGFMGVWSPYNLLKKEDKQEQKADLPTFVELPDMVVSIAGPTVRQLFLKTSLQLAPGDESGVESQIPRVVDSFNMFLSGIDPQAFDKRGILEIIRAELLTRARFVLGQNRVTDILVTEFRLQ